MLRIEISTDNAAFGDNEAERGAELARILRRAASLIERGSHAAPLRDINGNTVGRFDWERPL